VLRRNKRNRLPDTREWIEGREYEENHLSNVFESSSKNDMLEDAKDQVLEHAFDSVIEEIKPVDSDDSQKTDTLAVRHLALDMVEKLFQNMSNTYEKQRKKDYDWEYVLGKAIETGLPAP
jgi:hypothetical protein